MLHFDSSRFLDDKDDSFVSIDLNDDQDECDICHQQTDEPIVQVMLSHEFLRFERSFERTGDRLTKAHQICIERWSSIIERNMKFNNNKQVENKRQNDTPWQSSDNECNKNENVMFKNNGNNSVNESCCLQRKMSTAKLTLMNKTDIKGLLFKLESKVTDASNHLVDELQLRDKLCQEISGQKSLIEQLVKLKKNSPTLPRQPSLQTPVSNMSILA